MGGSGGAYVVRRAWTRAGASWFEAAAVLIGVCFLPHVEPAGIGHIELVLSPFALWTAAVCSSRRQAVQVDKQGITLHRLPPFRAPEFVPWADVVAVDWSGEEHFWGRTSSLTVHRRTARTVTALPPVPGLEALDSYLASEVDPAFVTAFRTAVPITRGTTLSDLDPVRLSAALTVLGPGVRQFGDLGDLAAAPSPPLPRPGATPDLPADPLP